MTSLNDGTDGAKTGRFVARTGEGPAHPRSSAAQPAFGVYVHVPFCARRCGYCDFNTYTAQDLGGGGSQEKYADTAIKEMELARQALSLRMGGSGCFFRPADTVFFGGGTPTQLPVADLVRMLAGVRENFGIMPQAEVTVEANPESVDEQDLWALSAGGFTRVSFGMQSAVPHVLRTLDRAHNPMRVGQVVEWARKAGLEVSLDLIYGAPGESMADWRCSLGVALGYGVDHLSCYALTVEPHTSMGRRIARGELPAPEDDDLARKYEIADHLVGRAGLDWYEISNFARPGHESRHNLGYWQGGEWWGIGPGAHSSFSAWPALPKVGYGMASSEGGRHAFGGGFATGMQPVRWWNVKHPRAYAAKVMAGRLPWEGQDWPDAEGMALERIMLGLRLAEGLPVSAVSPSARLEEVPALIAEGLLDGHAALDGKLVLTLTGRLLMDTITLRLAK